jgi:hypothetical protein
VPRIPNSGINYNGAFFQNFGYGIREQWAPNDRLKADLGVRFDGQNQHYGFNPFNPTEPGNPSDVNPSTITSKYTAAARNRTARRAELSDGSIRLPARRATAVRPCSSTRKTAGTPADDVQRAGVRDRVPALPASSGLVCGSGKNPAGFFPCQNYAQQLYWLYDQNFDAPDLGGALPALYNNYDITYQHQFAERLGHARHAVLQARHEPAVVRAPQQPRGRRGGVHGQQHRHQPHDRHRVRADHAGPTDRLVRVPLHDVPERPRIDAAADRW